MTPARRHMARIAALDCIICKRFQREQGGVQLHHIAEGSGVRSDFAVAPLCHEHHQGATGLHGMGPKAFLRFYRPPGETEWGLLAWVNEDLARAA